MCVCSHLSLEAALEEEEGAYADMGGMLVKNPGRRRERGREEGEREREREREER